MAKIRFSCQICEADYSISHDMDERMYQPNFCQFCGEEVFLEDDLTMDVEEE